MSVSLFLLIRLKVKVKGNVREKTSSAPTVRPSAPIFSEYSKSAYCSSESTISQNEISTIHSLQEYSYI